MASASSVKGPTLTVLLLLSMAWGCVGARRDRALLAAGFTREAIREHRAERSRLAHRPKRLLFDNDGCDAAYFPATLDATAENLLSIRTTPLTETHVDALCYCTISSGFGLFTHNTKVGQVLEHDLGMLEGRRNITTDLINQGTDTLRVMVDYCHAHNLECFWSMRMNDTHDGAHRPDKPYPLFPKLKQQRPELLNGTFKERPRHGSWTSVNYALPEVRDLAFRYIEEVCRSYDVDGIELDFFRHMSYLKSVAWGGEASAAERRGITDLMRRIRAVTEETGLRRGRPLLLAARVPDSAEYARRVGLDLEAWMREGLVDIMIGSGYFRLNPWQEWVALGKPYGTAMVAGLSESRTSGEDKRFGRGRAESYRARAMQAWQAGVHGIYIFNVYNAGTSWLKEVGEPDALAQLDKHYFATVRNGKPQSYLRNGQRFRSLPQLTPNEPWEVDSRDPKALALFVGDDLEACPAERKPTVACHLRFSKLRDPAALCVALNGVPLTGGTAAGEWVDLPVSGDLLRCGENAFSLALAPNTVPDKAPGWDMEYRCDHKMAIPKQLPWRRAFPACDYEETVVDGNLLLADRDTGPQDWPHLAYPWHVHPDDETTVEARLKVLKSNSPRGVCLRLANGRSVEYVTFEAGRVGLYFAGVSADVDTTGGFHTYRVRIRRSDIQVWVDGDLLLDATGAYVTASDDQRLWLDLLYGLRDWNRRSLYFGSATGPGTGEALWHSVRFRSETRFALLKDFVLSIDYPDGNDGK